MTTSVCCVTDSSLSAIGVGNEATEEWWFYAWCGVSRPLKFVVVLAVCRYKCVEAGFAGFSVFSFHIGFFLVHDVFVSSFFE